MLCRWEYFNCWNVGFVDSSRNQTPAIGAGKNDVTDEGAELETQKKIPTPVPAQSIYMLTAQFLLDINALKVS